MSSLFAVLIVSSSSSCIWWCCCAISCSALRVVATSCVCVDCIIEVACDSMISDFSICCCNWNCSDCMICWSVSCCCTSTSLAGDMSGNGIEGGLGLLLTGP